MSHKDHESRMNMLVNHQRASTLLNKLKDIESVHIDDIKVRVKIIDQNGKIPTKANQFDAGWDLYSTHDCTIQAGQRKTIKTGVSLQIPEGWVGLIWPRSGLSVKNGADILAGVIDSGYRGEVLVCLHNTNHGIPLLSDDNLNIKIKKGDRIAQILFQQVPEVSMVEVDDLSSSERGDKGFGSSGE